MIYLNWKKIYFKKGFIEKEIEKETDIQIDETSDHIEAPKPKEMIDLEVAKFTYLIYLKRKFYF